MFYSCQSKSRNEKNLLPPLPNWLRQADLNKWCENFYLLPYFVRGSKSLSATSRSSKVSPANGAVFGVQEIVGKKMFYLTLLESLAGSENETDKGRNAYRFYWIFTYIWNPSQENKDLKRWSRAKIFFYTNKQ